MSKKYLDNKVLLKELIVCQEIGQMTNKMIYYIKLMHSHIYNYNNQREGAEMDFLQDVYYNFLKNYQKFDIERSNQAFAWVTSLIKNSYEASNLTLNYSLHGAKALYRKNKELLKISNPKNNINL